MYNDMNKICNDLASAVLDNNLLDYSGPQKLDHREGGYLLRASQPQCPLRPGAVDLAGSAVVERLMRALLVVEPEVGRQARHQFGDKIIRSNVDVLVFHTPPESLDEHIVRRPPPTVHAHRHTRLLQAAGVSP